MNIKKKLAALTVASALVLGGVGVAQSASAAEIAGTITITNTSGNVNTDTYFLQSIAVSTPAPVGFRAQSGTFVYQGGAEMGSISNARTTSMPTTAGNNGLDGIGPVFMDRSISPTNNFVSNKLLNALTVPLATGQFELRFYYFASATAPNRATDPYVKLDMTYNATTGAWSVFTAATATTTSLTASAAASTVTLTATVLAGVSTATAAVGNVVFREGATTVATVPVASGVAIASLTGVANGSHSYTAEFVPTNVVYAGSTSGAASVQVGGITATSTINVTIPNNVGSLTLTGVSSSVNLGTATLGAGTLNASGTLNAVVTDTRQLDFPAWSLTGQVVNFTAGALTLDGKYLGWTPAATGVGTAGAVVAPTTGNGGTGLKTISQMAYGSPNAIASVTNASALLELKAPANTPAGAYAATVTLTLI